MKPQVILRHHAGAALYFSDLAMLAGDDTGARPDRGAVALSSDEFQLDPVLLVSTHVVQERWQVRSC